MIVLVEGPKNVGKSYLLEHSRHSSYKFPFIPYYKTMMADKPSDTGEGSSATFHFSASFDVTLFSMIESGLLLRLELDEGEIVLIDRSFMSNIVLGELQGRITHKEGRKYLDYLANQGYLKKAPMIYIDKLNPEDGRQVDKDDWEFLGYDAQKAKYEEYFEYLKNEYDFEPRRFVNKMTDQDIEEFDQLAAESNLAWTNGQY